MADEIDLHSVERTGTDTPINRGALPIKLVGMPLHPIPDDEVELEVREIVRSYGVVPCAMPDNVAAILGWQKVSIAEMIHWGTVYYQGNQLALGAGETDYLAQCRKIWSTINDYKPRAQGHKGRNRLTLAEQDNSDVQSIVTQILGVCMGVFIASKIFDVPISAITKRNFSPSVREDFDIQLGSSAVELEVRGRFHRNNPMAAVHEVDEKFGRTLLRQHVHGQKTDSVCGVTGSGDYSQHIGILAYPSDKPERHIPDIEIMDPETPTDNTGDGNKARRILEHYRQVLVPQRVRIVEELERLIGLSDDVLVDELRANVDRLTNPVNYQRGREVNLFGRTRVFVGDIEFLGTYFDGASAPTWISGPLAGNEQGVFFWGIAKSVLQQLGTLRILELAASSRGHQSGISELGTVIVLFDDGVLTAWSKSTDTLATDLPSLSTSRE